MKQAIIDNVKNISGWKTKRKIVVIAVDDYGNVRLDSKKARSAMNSAGLKVFNRFDAYDTLETREDLEALYEVLTSVKDKNDNHAIITPYALPCNINFEAMESNDYKAYIYELLPETYEKLTAKDPKAYQGTWQLWQQGQNEGLMRPQFHGREHFNLKVFIEKLQQRDQEVLTALQNRSYTSVSYSGYNTIKYTAAFNFYNTEDLLAFPTIIKTGLESFEKVYGYRAMAFTPPAQGYHESMLRTLKSKDIEILDRPMIGKIHLGEGIYKRQFNTMRFDEKNQITKIIRNVVFEPTSGKGANLALRQIEAAFRWNKPAVISSHRVNFCGHIDPAYRKQGLSSLKKLLSSIKKKWPEVEFMDVAALGNLINNNS